MDAYVQGHCVCVSAYVCMRVWARGVPRGRGAEKLGSQGLLLLADSHADPPRSLPGAAVTEQPAGLQHLKCALSQFWRLGV